MTSIKERYARLLEARRALDDVIHRQCEIYRRDDLALDQKRRLILEIADAERPRLRRLAAAAGMPYLHRSS